VARAVTHAMRCPRDWELTAIMKSRVPQKVRKSEIRAFGRQRCSVLSAKFLLTCIQTQLVVHICDKVKKETSPVLHALHSYVFTSVSTTLGNRENKPAFYSKIKIGGTQKVNQVQRPRSHPLIYNADK